MSKVFFASDLHLGLELSGQSSKERELIVAAWINQLPAGSRLYLLGDLFDYWYEYKNVIPQGYSHFFSSIRQAVDRGIEIVIFTGNHDIWMFDYFTKEYGIKVFHKYQIVEHQGKKIFIGHGDGLGPDDIKYKLVKKVLRNQLCQTLFRQLHPDFALRIMSKISRSSRHSADEDPYTGEKEWLVQYAERKLKQHDIDYFIFGHRHLLIDYTLSNGSRYINLGEWVTQRAFAELDNGELNIRFIDKACKIYN